MSINKNLTPRQLAMLAASAISISGFVLFSVLFFLGSLKMEYWVILVMTGAIFIISYIVVIQALQRYIYRKIKVIYKTIRKSKLKPEEKTGRVDLDEHIIDEVEKEVDAWVAIQNKEIDDLKALAEYRRTFLGDISHELKTPIFNIQGYLHTLLDGGLFDSNINEKYLIKAAKNVERLHLIIQDLEAIARMEAGELEMDYSSFNIKDLALDVIDDFEMKAMAKNIELRFKQGADKGFMVWADKEKIRQVLTNLVSNSIKYGVANGRTQFSFYDMDKAVLIEVADNGIGIDEEDLNRVFDRFYRVDKSRSREQGGTGLGLAIVKHIMEAHRQPINLRSSAGSGSTFGFTLSKEPEMVEE